MQANVQTRLANLDHEKTFRHLSQRALLAYENTYENSEVKKKRSKRKRKKNKQINKPNQKKKE